MGGRLNQIDTKNFAGESHTLGLGHSNCQTVALIHEHVDSSVLGPVYLREGGDSSGGFTRTDAKAAMSVCGAYGGGFGLTCPQIRGYS